MTFETLVNLCCEKYHMVSLVGGGGKTTTMYALAHACSRRGLRVLVSTTTHILKPEENFADNQDEVEALWGAGQYAVVGNRAENDSQTKSPIEKLRMPELSVLYEYVAKADLVLLEADGAKCLPCKVPSVHEPVILPECDLVIGVVGLSCLDRTVGEACFRKEMALEQFGLTEDTVLNEEILANILASEKGTRKSVGDREYVVILNQCDTPKLWRRGERIKEKLAEIGINHVILSSYEHKIG